MKHAFISLSIVLTLVFSCEAKLTAEQRRQLPAAATDKVDFARDIKPIFEASCVKCHGRGKEKGGFRLDTRETFLKGGDSGAAAVAGQSAESYLIELVSGLDPDNVMPVKGSKLNARQVGLLRAWIDQGMTWDASITFAKPPPLNLHPRQPELPPVARGLEHPVDRLLQPYFTKHNLKPAKPVDDRTFARRVHLDVVGLLPSPEEMTAFLADKRADKRERLVAHLLGDNRRFAEHWLAFWNDLLRNDYKGTGYIDGGREPISTWLYAALFQNKPFDRFVAELVNPDKPAQGFVKGIVWRGTVNASQIPPMQAAQNISQVFMGVNLKCASCHDSFINDWTLADAYNLANIYADEPLELFQCDKPTGKKAGMSFIYPELGSIPAGTNKTERTRRLAELITQKKNGRLTRTMVNRLWQKFLGHGLVEPVDEMEQPAWNPDLLDWLAEDLASNGYDLKRTMRLILTSRAYQLPAVSLDEQKHPDYVFTGPAIRRMTAEQFRDALGALTGVWYSEPAKSLNLSVAQRSKEAPATLPATLKWIWSEPDAVSRAAAETIYLRKLVTLSEVPSSAWAAVACDNSFTLYVNGSKVTAGNDWNAPSLVDLRPHLKKGTNLIAVAAVNHTRDNKPPAEGRAAPDEERNPAGFIFVAKLQSKEKTTEIVSDQTWMWSRQKSSDWIKPGGALAEAHPAVELGPPSLAPWNVTTALTDSLAMSEAHRDVRASLVASDPLTGALGRPPREQVATTRPSAATTLQALELTNGDTLNRVLTAGAKKLLSDKAPSSRELVTTLYGKALGRKPTAKELKLAGELLGEPVQHQQVEDLLWSMAMLPEFQLIY